MTKSWPSTSLAASTGLTASAKCDDGGPVLRVRVGRHLDVALGLLQERGERESAAIAAQKTAVRKPRVFTAEQGEVSGSAKLLAASAGARTSYEWEYSADGGKTWVTAPVTIQASTTVPGLTPGSTVQFRYRPVTKAGEGNWSQTVSLVVK
jgi:hypothetical protein